LGELGQNHGCAGLAVVDLVARILIVAVEAYGEARRGHLIDADTVVACAF
jgi:hypothetical protein